MNLWHLTTDAPRFPEFPCPGQTVELWIGTWPIEPDQSVWVEYHVTKQDVTASSGVAEASWHHNSGPNSYWVARLPQLGDGETVRYAIHGRSAAGQIAGPADSFRVGPRIHLAILWHQHQPLYLESNGPPERYRFPWVRFHAIRDYYSMAALVAKYPKVHVTINLVPSLLLQLEGYLEREATDRALQLTQKPARRLTEAERGELLGSFFDADWHNQIYVHPRYKELFEQRLAGRSFSTQDLTDLQIWFNLAWFAPELLDGEVRLHDGTRIHLEPLVRQGRGFKHADVKVLIEAQYAVMRNILPLHRALQEAGQIEVSTTPFYHPILPLVHDTALATMDRPEGGLPERFQAPEDAQAQVDRAVVYYEKRFGTRPRGMWPAEGAVGQSIVNHFVRAGVRWIASDQGVIERSGHWGYRTDNPDVLCQPYRAEGSDGCVSVFFRDTKLSDAIGFKYQSYPDQRQAAADFLSDLKLRLGSRVSDPSSRVVTVILDGENAWGSYRDAGRPFLHALYEALSNDPEIKTVTFSELLDGNSARAILAHPPDSQPKVYDLFHGSWIDEIGSAPGVDLGTWIGEDEENQAWDLLRTTRARLIASGATPRSHPEAFEALYAAEGSDWFWWFGVDQDSGYDEVFDDLFSKFLVAVHQRAGLTTPAELGVNLVPHTVVWTFTSPLKGIQLRDRLTVRTNCAGVLRWSVDDWKTTHEEPLAKAGGVMAGLHSYSFTFGPFPMETVAIDFVFRCTECGCGGRGSCCGAKPQRVLLERIHES